MITPPQDSITLKTYVEILDKAALTELRIEADSPDARPIRELLAAGLLSDARQEMGFMVSFGSIVLTPEGAAALMQWRDYLVQRSWRRQLAALAREMLRVRTGARAANRPRVLDLFR